MDKVRQVAEHVNLILRYVPYVQTNFVLGLDGDEGPEPFELTKRFVDLAPGAFPGYSLLSAFGRAAPMNLDYQRAGRVLPFPFHFLNNNHAMNVKPKNYSWPEFYDRLVDLTSYSFSWRAIGRRLGRHRGDDPAVDERGAGDVVGGLGADRVSHHDPGAARHRPERARTSWRARATGCPDFYAARIQRDLGDLHRHLPAGALMHDPNAYLKSEGPRTRHSAAGRCVARAPGRQSWPPSPPLPTEGRYAQSDR